MLVPHALAADSGSFTEAASTVGIDDILLLARALCRVPYCLLLSAAAETGWQLVAPTTLALSNDVLSEIAEIARNHAGGLSDAGDLVLVEDCLREQRWPVLRQLATFGIRFLAALYVEQPATGGVVLVVLDTTPRVLTSEQTVALAALTRQLLLNLKSREHKSQTDLLQDQMEENASRLRASEQLFRAFMDAGPFLSFVKDAAGRLLFYNRAYAQRFGISERAWLGRTDDALWSHTEGTAHPVADLDVMHSGRTVESNVRLDLKDQSPSHWKTYRFPCHDATGNLLLAGLALNVTAETERKAEVEQFQQELQQANDQLRRLSVTDALTGIRNRRAFEERLLLEFSMSRRRRRDLALMLLDIDDFKLINDQWGHPAGDNVLKRLAALLRTTVRLPDMVARYGGEEFALLLPESNLDAALGLSRRLVTRVAQEQWEHQPVTLSIGIASLNDSLLNGYQLVSMADEALYAAKRAGKNRVHLYGRDS